MSTKEEQLAERIYGQLKESLPEGSLGRVISLLFRKAEKEKKKVVVSLAAPPSPDLERAIDTKVKELFGGDAAPIYKIKPDILGGFILEGQGQYYNYSLDKRIDNLLKNERV